MFFILLGIIFLQHQLLIVNELKNKQELERYIKIIFDKNSYIKIIESKPLKLRRQFILNRQMFAGEYFNMVYNRTLEDGKRAFLKDIEPFIKLKNHFIHQSNEELIELELTIYKDDKTI